MWGLLLSAIVTSAVDSLNPVAITQQFVLQGMVKKPKHIWFFILPTGIVNLIGGFLAYYGLVALIGSYLGTFIQSYGKYVFIGELILGIAFLIGVSIILQNSKLDKLKGQIQAINQEQDNDEEENAEAKNKIKSVSPMALVLLGVGATISELATALPYFAFMAILLNHQLTFLQVAFILVLYNIIYMLPLMILYFVYMKAQSKFDALYKKIKLIITKWSNILAPTLVGIIGVFLVYHAVSLLIQ